MTEPHKRPHRHPTYKTAYRVKNWHEYDQSLRDRGDITLWISQDAIDAWSPPMTGKRGAQPVYADLAIETALTFRLLFHLPLRQTEGFLRSVLNLLDRRQQWLEGLRPRRMAYPKARGEAAQTLEETAHWGGYPGSDCRVHGHGKP